MPPPEPSLSSSLASWFREQASENGTLTATNKFAALLWEFLRDSMPDRRRQRYGDIDFDWDHRVDTTSATVSWRSRLVGLLHSPYQATDPGLFREMLANLKIEFQRYVFIDIGSGKGRALLMAADYPFLRIVGVELMPDLHHVAQKNIANYKSDSQKSFSLESVCCDAATFEFPSEPPVLYLFNPLPKAGLVSLLENLEQSLLTHPRPAFILYHNPILEHLLLERGWLSKIHGTHQYSIFVSLGK